MQRFFVSAYLLTMPWSMTSSAAVSCWRAAVPEWQYAGRKLTLGGWRRGVYLSILPVQSAEINSVRFEVDVANDYQVELSTNNQDFQVELSASGNVKDESNRRVHRFEYGELTDEATMGFDLQTTLLGFSIEAERAWYVQTKQYPLLSGKRGAPHNRRMVH